MKSCKVCGTFDSPYKEGICPNCMRRKEELEKNLIVSVRLLAIILKEREENYDKYTH